MKTFSTPSKIALCSLALLLPSAAFAGDAEDKVDRLDNDNDGRVSRAEFVAKGDRVFARIDANNDGKLTLAELREWKESRDKDDPKTFVGRNRFDRDDDGGLSPAERLKKLDSNGDDRVTLAEFAAHRKDRFKELDKNDDGFLKEKELD